jgi:signal transduction histidine kinase
VNIDLWIARLRGRDFRVDLAVGFALAILALFPPLDVARSSVPAVLLAFAAIALRRVSPGGALILAWFMAIVQISLNERPNFATITIVLVVYAGARLGNRWEVVAAGVSSGVGGVLATAYLSQTGARYLQLAYGPPEQRIVAAFAPVGILVSAWLAGLAVKFFRSQRQESQLRVLAESETARALDLAQAERLRATMARDVHDIVGHSLAVIIAQADSVEFLDDEGRIRAVSATIARTARKSLQEVRDVLSGTTTESAPDEPQDLDSIVEQVRAAGVVVEQTVRGERRAIDAAHGIVVRRVAQEMITNALRHGVPGEPIVFRESWRSSDVVIEVENRAHEIENPGTGSGIDGMRSRVASVGGSLEAEALEGLFTARARIPAPASDAGAVHAGPVHAGPLPSGPVHAGPVSSGPVSSGPVSPGPAVTTDRLEAR